ncbi:MAG: glycosyltransferase family 2 protein, partial [Thermoprotei archaeon]
ILAMTLLTIGISLLIYKPYRTWITTQIYLITATIRNLWTKETIWKKQTKS